MSNDPFEAIFGADTGAEHDFGPTRRSTRYERRIKPSMELPPEVDSRTAERLGMKSKPANHMPRSREMLERAGYQVATVETYNAFSGRKSDLWGFGDLIAVHPDQPGALIVQVTSQENAGARMKKAFQTSELWAWLKAGNRFHVHGWHKPGHRWECSVRDAEDERAKRAFA